MITHPLSRSTYKLFFFIILPGLAATTVISAAPETTRTQRTPHEKTQETATKTRQKQWQLTDPEMRRYQELMQGIRGSISPSTLSPLEVLGTHARNEQERRKYAKRWAKMMYQDIERTLAFNQVFREEYAKLIGNQTLVDYSKLELKNNPATRYQNGDRFLAFIKPDQCNTCQPLVTTLLKETRSLAVQVDIYFLDIAKTKQDSTIRQWVKAMAIDPKRIQSKRITFNYDHGQLQKLTGEVISTQIPQFYRQRSGILEKINL